MFAAAVLAADVAATLDLNDRSEVRARVQQTSLTVPVTLPAPPVSVDVLTQPDARLHVFDRRWDFTLGYDVMLLAPDVELSLAPLVLQTGSTSIAWHDRRLKLTLSEDVTYGQQNSAYLSATPTAAGPPVTTLVAPAPTTLLYGSTRTALVGVYRVDRRTILTLGTYYLVSGGLDSASQATLPEQFGEGATATLEYALTRSDALVTAASAAHVDFSQTACLAPPGQTIDPTLVCQPSDDLVQAVERLRHTLSKTASFTLGVGSALSAVREQAGVGYHYAYYPVAEAAYLNQFDRQGSLTLTARLAPYIDPRTGIVLNALYADAALLERFTRKLTLTVLGGVSQNLPAGDPDASSVVRGEVSVEYRFGRRLYVSLGERAFWETTNGLGSFASVVGYLAVTVREPTLHF